MERNRKLSIKINKKAVKDTTHKCTKRHLFFQKDVNSSSKSEMSVNLIDSDDDESLDHSFK